MSSSQATKTGGGKEFWGLSLDYDPQWLLNKEQREIQEKLIETCRTLIRPNAVSIEFNANLITDFYEDVSLKFCVSSKTEREHIAFSKIVLLKRNFRMVHT